MVERAGWAANAVVRVEWPDRLWWRLRAWLLEGRFPALVWSVEPSSVAFYLWLRTDDTLPGGTSPAMTYNSDLASVILFTGFPRLSPGLE
jgi:hypothetical protein